MAIWIKTPPDAEPVWMAADNRIRELALSIVRRAGIAPDACKRDPIICERQQGVNKNRKDIL